MVRRLQHPGRAAWPLRNLLRQVFGFDELTVEDCFTRSHLPKVDIYDDYLFVALFSFYLSEKTRRVQTVEVDMYVGENYVVCIGRRQPERPELLDQQSWLRIRH